MPPSTFSTSKYAGPQIWYVQYSNRMLWHGKRNVKAIVTTSNALAYSYQDLETLEIKTCEETEWKIVGVKVGKLQNWKRRAEEGKHIMDGYGDIISFPFNYPRKDIPSEA
jgi:hypothetical protein